MAIDWTQGYQVKPDRRAVGGSLVTIGGQTYTYIPADELYSGITGNGKTYYPSLNADSVKALKGMAPVTVPGDIASAAINGPYKVDKPNVGYLLSPEQYSQVYNAGRWFSPFDTSLAHSAGAKLTEDGTYVNQPSAERTITINGVKGTYNNHKKGTSAFVAARDALEAVGSIAGNYFLPGSGMLTSKLVSNGAQDYLNSTLGKVAMIGSGVAGGVSGNLSNYGKLIPGAGTAAGAAANSATALSPEVQAMVDSGYWTPAQATAYMSEAGANLAAGAATGSSLPTASTGGLMNTIQNGASSLYSGAKALLTGGNPGSYTPTEINSTLSQLMNEGGMSATEAMSYLADGLGTTPAALQTAMEGGAAISAGAGTGLLSNAASGLNSALGTSLTGGNLLSGGLSLAGGLLNAGAAKDAAKTQADAQIRAAQIAADAAKFKPVGVTTRFGQSNFGYDANGNLTSAGYTLSPDVKAQQDALMATSGGLLTQYQGAQGATAPMGTAAQRAMTLGNGYLATDPAAQAKMFYDQQMALLNPSNERSLAELRNNMQQTGRSGLMTGGTSTMQASNPELNAYYNALLQQQNQIAADATKGGMDYAKFGTGMVGAGGDLLKSMYGTQSEAFNPYATAFGGAQQLEGAGQQALDTGINIGAKGTAANAQSGLLLGQGLANAANTVGRTAQTIGSPWGNILQGGGQMLSGYKFDPMTGRAL